MRQWISARCLRLLLSLTAASMLLAACGFHLREPVALPFSSIYIGLPVTSPLAAELKRQIRSTSPAQISDTRQSAQVVLEVLSEKRDKQILSLNSQGRVREYKLIYDFSFRVRTPDGKELMDTVNIQLSRTLTFNEAQVRAKEAEEALLFRDMQNDLVQQVLRRLSVLKPEA
ncbi:LPS-assembly lipoprotein LptE [Undibacterium squillarum]|uniref:LPS-assembly lipoprotein LptE n=1 Tax=Undibacterium squillarum TaxID=1131567 RepID=A0ABQ2Y0P5_9BURK|nr:LPS assembly lipoprotein LptE [Undibacterium squillarum]GGX46059.1 hypothetical protein GCM10010946_25700 [Undibacterium squillarum]